MDFEYIDDFIAFNSNYKTYQYTFLKLSSIYVQEGDINLKIQIAHSKYV